MSDELTPAALDCPCCGMEVLGIDETAGEGDPLPCGCSGAFVVAIDSNDNAWAEVEIIGDGPELCDACRGPL